MDQIRPNCRATIINGQITLNRWSATLMSGGPSQPILDLVTERQVVLADLTRLDDRELVVTFIAGGGAIPEARATLIEWAQSVGYSRVWLDDRIVDLEHSADAIARASVTCPTCEAIWTDSSPEFWEVVLESGYFPNLCPVCAGSLPEWIIDGQSSDGGAAGAPRRLKQRDETTHLLSEQSD